jgi:hypothetical protein
LDSLIAYARQSARRAQSKAPTRWSRLWLPGAAASVAALGLVVVISSRVNNAANLSRSALTAPAEQEPRAQDRVSQAAPPARSTNERPAFEALRGNDDGSGLAEVSGGVSTAPPEPAARHRKSEPKSAFRLASPGAKTDALAGDLGNLDEKRRSEDRRDTAVPVEPKIGAGEIYGRAGGNSAPAGASQAAQGMARSPVTNVVVTDPRQRIADLRQTLSNPDLSDAQRATLLGQLCALLYEAGQRSEAESTCDAVIRDFPKTDSAATARRLKAQYAPPPPRPQK